MKNINMWHIIGLLVIISLICVGIFSYKLGKDSNKPIDIDKIDTTRIDTIIRRDTIVYEKPIETYITKLKTVRDTLLTTDTIQEYVEVEVPIEEKTYNNSNYYAVVSGYKASLDTIKVYPITETITIDKTITKIKKPNIVITPSVGFGYGFINKKADIFLGVTVGYPIWSK